jgi:hypothetical protein
MTKVGGLAMGLVIAVWGGLAFVLLAANDGTALLILLFLSVPFGTAALLIFALDWMWRSHQATQEQQPSHRDVAELMRPRDPPG